MKLAAIPAICCFAALGCSTPPELEIPNRPDLPLDWNQLSQNRFDGSECPVIGGVYQDLPLTHAIGRDLSNFPEDTTGLYGGYVSFHRGARTEISGYKVLFSDDQFVIEQQSPESFQFYLKHFVTRQVIKYEFRMDEGDYTCVDGYIQFPDYQLYGLIEGTTTNVQVRREVSVDSNGALLLFRTIGPARGDPSKAAQDFIFESLKYQPAR